MYCILSSLLFITGLVQNSKATSATVITSSDAANGVDGAPFCDDFAESSDSVDGLDGWTIHVDPKSGDTSKVSQTASSSYPIDGKYHGDFSGANIYAQGTVNSFYRYFQCSTNAKVHVKFNVASCGTELEDKIFFEIDGVQLGQDIELGCINGRRPRSEADLQNYPTCASRSAGATNDRGLKRTCPANRSGGRCNRNEYNKLGTYSFDEISEQVVTAGEPFQARFFFRYSYQDDHIWIYNIQIGCELVDGHDPDDTSDDFHDSTIDEFVWGKSGDPSTCRCSPSSCNGDCTSDFSQCKDSSDNLQTCGSTGCNGDTTCTTNCNTCTCNCQPATNQCRSSSGSMYECGSTDCNENAACTTNCDNINDIKYQPGCNWKIPTEGCNDDNCNPGYFHDQYIVSFRGTIQWADTGTSGVTRMGENDNGYIGQILEDDARPKFPEIFSVVNNRGITSTVRIDTDGIIRIRSWAIGVGFEAITDGNARWYYLQRNLEQTQEATCQDGGSDVCTVDVSRYGMDGNLTICEGDFRNNECPYDIILDPTDENTPSRLARVSLDGITYISKNAFTAVGESTQPQPIEFIKSPLFITITFASFAIMGIFIAITLKIISCCFAPTNKYSAVKVVDYNDTETE